MAAITRDFPLEQLMDWDVPYSDDAIHTTSEACVFRAPDDGLIYRFEFSPQAAASDDMDWYDDMPRIVTAERVELRQAAVDAWTPVEDDDADLARLQQTAEAEAGLRQALVDADGSVTAAEADRDEARKLARTFYGIALDSFDSPRSVFKQLGLDVLPDWLTKSGDPE